ncbi:FHA domain-containing protein [Undibacterium sp. JH2W]|uniref:FHA domain-containing protein n=1 Tax=Undibacterium sp. JH2W TaxID=3413037 RepID=UPI003BF2423A
MKKCLAPDHPHCTHWVAEGETVCAAGHPQRPGPQRLELLHASAGSLMQNREATAPASLHLHFSGYDPRAAGGRQTIRLELRGMLPLEVSIIEVQLRSDLIASTASKQRFQRTVSGLWQPLLLSFSSKNKEHGQYPLEVVLSHEQASRARRKWLCTSVIFVPRADASLTEIHSVFLAAQKNVRVVAEDGAIATLSGLGQSNGYAQGNMNIEINARDASIAKLEMRPPTGKYESAMGTIAWDEELIEVAAGPETTDIVAPARSSVAQTAKMATAVPAIKIATKTATASLIAAQSRIRLFALDEWVLGRMEEKPQADILLSHHAHHAAENARLTRRISARHAIIRRKGEDAEIIDTSRYGTLLDGISMEKDQAYALRLGMQIEFCASVRGIVRLQVMAILPHLIILAGVSGGPGTELLYLMKPDTRPETMLDPKPESELKPLSIMPMLFHNQGQIWHRDMLTLQDTRLGMHTEMKGLAQLPSACRYASLPYADIGG